MKIIALRETTKGFYDILLEQSAMKKLKNGEVVIVEFPELTLRLTHRKINKLKLPK